MEYDFADDANTVQSMQDVSSPHITMSKLFLYSDSNRPVAPGCEILPPAIAEDEDMYTEEEGGEVSTDNGDSRAGGREPNMEYGDALVMDNDHYKDSWEVFTLYETTTAVQCSSSIFSCKITECRELCRRTEGPCIKNSKTDLCISAAMLKVNDDELRSFGINSHKDWIYRRHREKQTPKCL
ncbi:hypothetical protein DL98DRAFT_584406 [Cadophora sp. DSE1049]|nr:hypothetical protein DL98DRAFT_584406 [Cadophora sp. DSE1049]